MTPLRLNIAIGGTAVAGAVFFVLLAVRVNVDALAALLVTVSIIGAWFDIRFLLVGWFLASPYLAQTGETGATNIASNFTHNLFVPAMAAAIFMYRLLAGRRLRFGKEDLLLLLFVAYAVASSILITHARYDDIRQIYLLYLVPFLLYAVVKNIDVDTRVLQMLAFVSFFHLVTLSMMSVYEYATGDILYRGVMDWTEVGLGRRFAGPFGSPIILGVFVPITLLYIYLAFKYALLPRYVMWISALLGTQLIIVTFTRSVWLGAFLAFVYIVYRTGGGGKAKIVRLGLFLTAAVVLIGALTAVSPAIQERLRGEENANFRIVMAQASINMVLDKPVTGWGVGTFDEVSDRYLFDALGVYIVKDTSHVTLLTILAELGVLGTTFLLLFIYFSLRRKGLRIKELPWDDQLILAANIGGIISFVVNAFLIDMRFFTLAYSWFFLNIGFVYKIYDDNRLTRPVNYA